MKRAPSLDSMLDLKRRADLALQSAWDERARAHELLTQLGIEAGGLVHRIRLAAKRIRDLEAEVAYLRTRPQDGAL